MRPRGEVIEMDFRYRGVRCRETLKLKPTKENLRFAKNMRGEILNKIAKGSFRYSEYFPDSSRVALFGGPRAGNMLVEEALTQWVRSHRQDVSPATLREYEKAINKHLIPAFKDIPLKNLKKAEIKEWRANLSVSPKTANNILIPGGNEACK